MKQIPQYFQFALGKRVRMSVCLCASITLQTAYTIFVTVSVRVARGRGSVLFWRQCNMLCTSGFVDDVMDAHNRPGIGDAKEAFTQSDSTAA